MKRYRTINDQNGAAMVEFAIVLPLLLTLIFGMIEFSVMLYDKAMLTNATREWERMKVLEASQVATGQQLDNADAAVSAEEPTPSSA